jgi:hypothetical protein
METLAAMTTMLAGFDLGVISPADYLAARETIRGGADDLEQAHVDAESDERQAHRVAEILLAELHKSTVRALAVVRVAWAGDQERMEVVAPLRASAQKGAAILGEAEAWETAWAELDPAYAPVPELTLPGFQAQIVAAQEALAEARRMTVRRQRAGARLALALASLNQFNLRLYAVATAMFGPETPEGEMVRKTITTTYVPRYHEAAKRRRAARRAEKAAPAETPAPAPAAAETPAT